VYSSLLAFLLLYLPNRQSRHFDVISLLSLEFSFEKVIPSLAPFLLALVYPKSDPTKAVAPANTTRFRNPHFCPGGSQDTESRGCNSFSLQLTPIPSYFLSSAPPPSKTQCLFSPSSAGRISKSPQIEYHPSRTLEETTMVRFSP